MNKPESLFPPELEDVLELACTWCEQQEQVILDHGVPLTELELLRARQIGVAQPEKVRLLCVDEIPQPQDLVLRAAAEQYSFLSSDTMGLALRYGILIRSEVWREEMIIVHELVHTAQYERFGGIKGFLTQYLGECLTVGYNQSPLEREAITVARKTLE